MKLSYRAVSYRAAGTFLLGLGVMATIGALFFGLSNVTVGIEARCGNGFGGSSSTTSDFGVPCAAAESSREAVTHGLLGAGIGGIVAGAVVFAFSARASDEKLLPEKGSAQDGEAS